MSGYLLDTNHASALMEKHAGLLQRVSAQAAESDIGLPQPVAAELWFMIFNSARIEENRAKLEIFLDSMKRWEFDEPAAEEYGRIKASLRRIGRPIPDMDIQIAAIAIVNGRTVLTTDAHFGYIVGLRTENWTN